MKTAVALTVLAFLLFSPAVFAGTFENWDSTDYEYRVQGDGIVTGGEIYGQSTLYGFCDQGCRLTLVGAGQTITMLPGDTVIIENGVLKIQQQ
jgi:hypothetical protein